MATSRGCLGREFCGAHVPRCFAARAPCRVCGVEELGVAADLDQAADVLPRRAHRLCGHRPHRSGSGLDAIALADLIVVMDIAGWALFRQRHHRVQQFGLIGFELHQHVIAAVYGDLQCFFDSAAHPA
jgi:hypothetical protein